MSLASTSTCFSHRATPGPRQRVKLAAAAVALESAGGSSGGPVMNSEEFFKLQAEQHEFAHRWVNLYLKCDPHQGEIVFDKETKRRPPQRSFKLNWVTSVPNMATLTLMASSPFSMR